MDRKDVVGVVRRVEALPFVSVGERLHRLAGRAVVEPVVLVEDFVGVERRIVRQLRRDIPL